MMKLWWFQNQIAHPDISIHFLHTLAGVSANRHELLIKTSGALAPATSVSGAASDISSKSSFVRFNLKELILSSRFLILVVPTCISNEDQYKYISTINLKSTFSKRKTKYKATSCDFSNLVTFLLFTYFSIKVSSWCPQIYLCGGKNYSCLFNGESTFI